MNTTILAGFQICISVEKVLKNDEVNKAAGNISGRYLKDGADQPSQ